GMSPLSWNAGVKFLMARKFDVHRAIELFHSYRETKLKEGIVELKPHEEPLRSELLSGKFTILVRASIALFTAKLHQPNKTLQHVVLQALFYLLDQAIESFETQRNGLVFIYDMAGSAYTNFEYDLSKKILHLLKGAFPARLKKVFIVGAPVWFRFPYSVLSLILKEKLRERVQMVKTHELKQHLPGDCLPEHLGGAVRLDHSSWNRQFLALPNGQPESLDKLITGFSREEESVHVPGLEGMTVEELLDHVNTVQKRGIYEEYEDIRRETPPGTFNCSLQPYNQQKNRYGDVLCLDQTRVKLKSLNHDERTDYINASFMDGYKQKNAFIGTQGKGYYLQPIVNLCGKDFILLHRKLLITQPYFDFGRKKCGQYWPLEQHTQGNYGLISVRNMSVEIFKHYNKTTLEIRNGETYEGRKVIHFQYLSWPDYGVPSSAAALIDFRSAVRRQQELCVRAVSGGWRGHPGGPPILVHCSAGIGRTGTLCTLDICLSQLQDVGTLNVYQTVRRMRGQRAFSIQTPDQYYFCYTAIIEHAQRQHLLPTNH
uniref:Tyrosine-protein phosphatase non-receptor type 9 n=1 Tax=Callorhinchus milii TaxID=7868 RepID=A0A4W3GQ87_CALMI